MTANALHPGVIGTKLLHAAFGINRAPIEHGTCMSVFLAVSDDVAGVSGKYFVDAREGTPSREARDDLAGALWAASKQLLAPFL